MEWVWGGGEGEGGALIPPHPSNASMDDVYLTSIQVHIGIILIL